MNKDTKDLCYKCNINISKCYYIEKDPEYTLCFPCKQEYESMKLVFITRFKNGKSMKDMFEGIR